MVLQAVYSGDSSPVVFSMLKLMELQECRDGVQKMRTEFQFLNGASTQKCTVSSSIVLLMGGCILLSGIGF